MKAVSGAEGKKIQILKGFLLWTRNARGGVPCLKPDLHKDPACFYSKFFAAKKMIRGGFKGQEMRGEPK